MGSGNYVYFGISVCALCVVVTAHASSRSSGQAHNLEHMDYASARKVILADGWSPVLGHCEQVSKDTCARFPEIDSCSGVGLGYCGMVFVKQRKCLYVVTTGGQPDGGGKYLTVETVTFRHGQCSKN
jgi:hypothetical protein